MNSISLFIYCAILSTFSATQIKPKLCVDCKFFKSSFLNNNKLGKCYMFPIAEKEEFFLVDGIKRANNDYNYCSISRLYDEMCGKDGKLYEKK